jgi:hypothetical protein
MRSVRGSMRIRVDRGVSASVRRGRVGGGKQFQDIIKKSNGLSMAADLVEQSLGVTKESA